MLPRFCPPRHVSVFVVLPNSLSSPFLLVMSKGAFNAYEWSVLQQLSTWLDVSVMARVLRRVVYLVFSLLTCGRYCVLYSWVKDVLVCPAKPTIESVLNGRPKAITIERVMRLYEDVNSFITFIRVSGVRRVLSRDHDVRTGV